jgi:thiol-disulfide isomerase/thioredoxin
MKKSFFLLLIFLASFNLVQAQKIEWMTLAEAMEAQKAEPKKIFMDVYTDWCGPCKLLDKNTFQNPDVSNYISEHYYAVKFNAEGQEEINFFDQTFTNPNYDPNRKGQKRNPSIHPISGSQRVILPWYSLAKMEIPSCLSWVIKNHNN